MKHFWKWNQKLAVKLGVDEVKLFAFMSTIVCACLFFAGFIIVDLIHGWGMDAALGADGLIAILSGADIGLFGSVLWMLRDETIEDSRS